MVMLCMAGVRGPFQKGGESNNYMRKFLARDKMFDLRLCQVSTLCPFVSNKTRQKIGCETQIINASLFIYQTTTLSPLFPDACAHVCEQTCGVS